MSLSTIQYYEQKSKSYFESTAYVDMQDQYALFLKYIISGGRILDLGCGSGRDLKCFLEKGFAAEGLDGSAKLCELAADFSGGVIHLGDIRSWVPPSGAIQYDGIWACASLLHLTEAELYQWMHHMQQYLADNGVLYMSMKSGITEGVDEDGRYFLNFTDDVKNYITQENPNLRIVEETETADISGRSSFIWKNLIFKKIRK